MKRRKLLTYTYDVLTRRHIEELLAQSGVSIPLYSSWVTKSCMLNGFKVRVVIGLCAGYPRRELGDIVMGWVTCFGRGVYQVVLRSREVGWADWTDYPVDPGKYRTLASAKCAITYRQEEVTVMAIQRQLEQEDPQLHG